MRTAQEKKTYFLLIAITLLTIGIVAGIIYPAMRDIQNLKEDTANLRNFLEKRYQRTMQSRSSVHKVDSIKDQVALLNEHLYLGGKELEFINLLENLSARYNLEQKINSSNLDDPEKQALEFNLITTGSYKAVIKYLNELENSPYFINLKNISLTPAGQTPEKETVVRLVFDISLYVSK